MKFMRSQITDKINYLVFDIEDISAKRACVCAYRKDELQEAIEHADNRGGIVVSADWNDFIGCEHVAPGASVADIAEQAMSLGIDEKSFRLALAALTFIRVNSPEGSQRAQWAAAAVNNCAAVQGNRWYLGLPKAA